MSLCIVCPSCQETVTFHFGEVRSCPHCGAVFDEGLQKTATANLALQTVGRPILISIGGVLTALGLGVSLLMILATLLNAGTFTIGEQQVTSGEFFRVAGLYLIINCLMGASLCYAIWTEKDWGRPLMLASWVVGWASYCIPFWRGIDAATLIFVTIFNGIGMGLAAWYLYGSERVKAYYKFLEMKADAKKPSSVPSQTAAPN